MEVGFYMQSSYRLLAAFFFLQHIAQKNGTFELLDSLSKHIFKSFYFREKNVSVGNQRGNHYYFWF